MNCCSSREVLAFIVQTFAFIQRWRAAHSEKHEHRQANAPYIHTYTQMCICATHTQECWHALWNLDPVQQCAKAVKIGSLWFPCALFWSFDELHVLAFIVQTFAFVQRWRAAHSEKNEHRQANAPYIHTYTQMCMCAHTHTRMLTRDSICGISILYSSARSRKGSHDHSSNVVKQPACCLQARRPSRAWAGAVGDAGDPVDVLLVTGICTTIYSSVYTFIHTYIRIYGSIRVCIYTYTYV